MTGTGTRQMPVVQALAAGECLTTAVLTEMLGLDRRVVADACCKLVTRGWIVRRERGCFEISVRGKKALARGGTITSGPVGPHTQGFPRRLRKETKRDVIWRAIRIQVKFSIADIETLSGATGYNIRRYVYALTRAGYLVPLRSEKGTAPTSNGFKRWALVNDPGPKTPIWRAHIHQMFDPNSNQAIEVS